MSVELKKMDHVMKSFVSAGFAILVAAFGVPQAWAHGGGGMGGVTENDICSMEKGQYFIHFSAYQHAPAGSASQLAQLKALKDADTKRYLDAMKEEFQSYCRDIPRTGKATLTFDLISDALRKIPVAVRVVEAAEGGDATPILYIPQQVYPSGVVKAETNFAKAGKYKAIVELPEHPGGSTVGTAEVDGHRHEGIGGVSQNHATTREEEAYHVYDSTLSFPFTVGLKTPKAAGRGSSMMSNPAILVVAAAGMVIGGVLYLRRKRQTV